MNEDTYSSAPRQPTPKPRVYREGRPKIRNGDLVWVKLQDNEVIACRVVHVNEGKARFSLSPVHAKPATREDGFDHVDRPAPGEPPVSASSPSDTESGSRAT